MDRTVLKYAVWSVFIANLRVALAKGINILTFVTNITFDKLNWVEKHGNRNNFRHYVSAIKLMQTFIQTQPSLCLFK